MLQCIVGAVEPLEGRALLEEGSLGAGWEESSFVAWLCCLFEICFLIVGAMQAANPASVTPQL